MTAIKEPSLSTRRQRTPKTLLPALLGSARWQILHSGWRMFLLYLLFQGATTLIALPVIFWLFREVLSAAGLHGVDMSTLGNFLTVPASLALFVVLVWLALAVMSLQLASLLLACRQLRSLGTFTFAQLGSDLAGMGKKLLRPSSFAMLLYLFFILPLTGFGFLSALTRTIAIPEFISGELMKSTGGQIGFALFLLAVVAVNVRLALVLPIFALTDAKGFACYRQSWRRTRHAFLSLLFAMVIVVVLANVVGFVLIAAGTLPTALTDAVAPSLSPVTAAIGLAFAEVVGLLLVGLTVVAVSAVVLELFDRTATPPQHTVLARAAVTSRDRRTGTMVVAGVLLAAMALLTMANVPAMAALQVKPETLVLGHRGFSGGGVENTIGGLEAAAAAGADLVEMDVMETSDGQFVVMHDASLSRLAGKDLLVANLTLAEITAIQVADLGGHEGLVPSFADYLRRAKELNMPLLVEIKLHGGEKPNLVPRMIAEMESLDAFDNNIYHSLDKPSVEELKRLRPAAYVGYTMAFAGVAVPATNADFIVVEEWSYSSKLRDAAWASGKEIYLWTVNTENGLRQSLRDEVDGIITDHPDNAVAARTQMHTDKGLWGVLNDSIKRFVTVL